MSVYWRGSCALDMYRQELPMIYSGRGRIISFGELTIMLESRASAIRNIKYLPESIL